MMIARNYGWLLSLVALTLFPGMPATAQETPSAIVLTIEGPIGPATADYVSRSFRTVAEREPDLVILRIDTPGGLDVSMRDIIRVILASPVPVASFVHPAGARAASAGTFLLYASHIAAMSPATNLGAATPVSIGGGMPSPAAAEPEDEDAGEESTPAPPRGDAMAAKITNDAVAYIRSLAELRGRNADWAERAVREGASLSATAALEENVIDILAENVPDLLRQIDGRTVKIGDRLVTISTEGMSLEAIDPDWRNQLLAAITNPNVALILMLVGVYGLILEFSNPGALLPGTVGSISLIVALYALAALPVNYAGLGLIGLGVALMVAEALTPVFGILGLGGVFAMGLGAMILIDGRGTGFEVSPVLVVGLVALSLVLVLWIVRLAARSYTRRVVTGREMMLGARAEVLDWQGGVGHVRLAGQRWSARADRPLRGGDTVTVTGIDGLTLAVTSPEPEPDHITRS